MTQDEARIVAGKWRAMLATIQTAAHVAAYGPFVAVMGQRLTRWDVEAFVRKASEHARDVTSDAPREQRKACMAEHHSCPVQDVHAPCPWGARCPAETSAKRSAKTIFDCRGFIDAMWTLLTCASRVDHDPEFKKRTTDRAKQIANTAAKLAKLLRAERAEPLSFLDKIGIAPWITGGSGTIVLLHEPEGTTGPHRVDDAATTRLHEQERARSERQRQVVINYPLSPIIQSLEKRARDYAADPVVFTAYPNRKGAPLVYFLRTAAPYFDQTLPAPLGDEVLIELARIAFDDNTITARDLHNARRQTQSDEDFSLD